MPQTCNCSAFSKCQHLYVHLNNTASNPTYFYRVLLCGLGVLRPLMVDSSILMIHVFLSEEKLYYVGAKKEEKREVVIEAERKRQIFLDCHFNDIGHHLGQKKTVHRIQSKYYWLGIIRDVVDWVQRVFGILLTSPGRSC